MLQLVSNLPGMHNCASYVGLPGSAFSETCLLSGSRSMVCHYNVIMLACREGGMRGGGEGDALGSADCRIVPVCSHNKATSSISKRQCRVKMQKTMHSSLHTLLHATTAWHMGLLTILDWLCMSMSMASVCLGKGGAG